MGETINTKPNIQSKPELLCSTSITSPQPMAIVYRKLSELKPNPENARIHNAKQRRQIVSSLKKFGPISPIVIDVGDQIMVGHGRHQAALDAGFEEFPTIQVSHLTPAQIKAYGILDNKLCENSAWDRKLLAKHFMDFEEMDLDFDPIITGFEHMEIAALLDELVLSGGSDPDHVPPLVGQSVSKKGDLWMLSEHRVLHGDATDLAYVTRLMGDKTAVMVFTDPPYGVDYGNSAKDKIRGTQRKILNDNLGGEFGAFLFAACSNMISVTKGAMYICMSSSELHTLYKAFTDAGGHWSTFIIWAKNTFTLGRSDYQRQFEPILYGWPKGTERLWCGDRDQSDVWFYDKPAKSDLHPTMKPIELVMRAIKNSSGRGDIVLDSFLGSGTTLIAAERMGRICYGMELDGQYITAIIQRWQRHTGLDAIHAESGKTFNQLAAEMEVHHE